MADAMQQGIMTLPPEMGGMEQPPQSYLTPDNEALFNQLRQSVSKKDFSNEMLNAAEQVDPQAVAQLRSMLGGMQLPPELVDLIQQMIDMLLRDPGNYPQLRAKFLAEGVPEELLPPEFDPEFFAAMDMALDQVSGPTPQGFAGGGMAMNPIAGGLASLGRYGDTMMAHITPQEAMMLRRAGGSGSINPVTGLPEFFNLFSAIGNAFKAVGNAVVGVVKGIGSAIKSFVRSDIGRIITTIALAYFLGPGAASAMGISSEVGVAAVSGFVGGAGSTLLAGGSFKDALKMGAIGGLTAGAMSGISGGAGAFQSGSYTGPTTVGGQWRSFAQKLADSTGLVLPGAKAQIDLTNPADAVVPNTSTPADAVVTNTSTPAGNAARDANFANANSTTGADVQARQAAQAAIGNAGPPQRVITNYPYAPHGGPGTANTPSIADRASEGTLVDHVNYNNSAGTSSLVNEARGVNDVNQGGAAAADVNQGRAAAAKVNQSIRSLIKDGQYVDALKKGYSDYLSPSKIQEAGAQQAEKAGYAAYDRAIAAGKSEALASASFKLAYDAAMPGMLATYGPSAAAGVGAIYLAGGFTPPPTPKPNIPISGEELYKKNPYLITPQIRTISASTGQDYRYAAGGIADLMQGTKNYPRKQGPIDGPGTGTSDEIPAMLSDGEFVFTAKSVRNMGKGSRRKGAKRMYALMKALEKRA